MRVAELGPLSADAIGVLGRGWTAGEALAIASHCALTADSFLSGVLHAVNHDGDSDSTGAICGNLLGAALGAAATDGDLLARQESGDVIIQVADDLCLCLAAGSRLTLPGSHFREPPCKLSWAYRGIARQGLCR